MKPLKLSFPLATLAALAMFGTALSPTAVEARPKYKEVFTEKYPALAAQVKKVKCGVCHPPGAEEKKKVRNNYGQALGKVLGAKTWRTKTPSARRSQKSNRNPAPPKAKPSAISSKPANSPAKTNSTLTKSQTGEASPLRRFDVSVRDRPINNCRIFRPLTLPSPPRGEGT